MKIQKTLIAVFLLFLAAAGLNAKEVALYHTSDIHGYYFAHEDKQKNKIGGFAALETLLEQETLPFILVDSGDFSSGNKEANFSNGRYSINLLNKAGKSKKNAKHQGYSAITVGNHDSDFGAKKLAKMLNKFKGKVLAANLEAKGVKFKPYKVFNINDVKIGIIGFAMTGPGAVPNVKTVPLTGQELDQITETMLKKGAQTIIILAHDSVSDARKPSVLLDIIKEAPLTRQNLSLVLGGHAHNLKKSKPLPEDILFAESGSMLEGTTKVVFDFDDETGKLKNRKATYIKLDLNTYPENEEIKQYLNIIEDKSLTEVFAKVGEFIPKYPAKDSADRSCPLAKMIADEMLLYPKGEQVDFAMFQLPGVRRDLNAGNLTGRDIAELLPYTEYVSTVDISGAKILQAAQDSLKYDETHGSYSMFSYSKNVNIKFSRKDGAFKIVSFTVDGKEIDPTKTYRVAAISHIPDGYYEGAPWKVENANKKIYDDNPSGILLFNIVEKLEGNTAEEKNLITPKDIRIKEVKA